MAVTAYETIIAPSRPGDEAFPQVFRTKRVSEVLFLAVDWVNRMPSGTTLSSATNWVATVKSGTDASPSSIISGSAAVSGSLTTQKITAGTDGVVYYLEAAAVTSDAQTLELLCELTVDDAES